MTIPPTSRLSIDLTARPAAAASCIPPTHQVPRVTDGAVSWRRRQQQPLHASAPAEATAPAAPAAQSATAGADPAAAVHPAAVPDAAEHRPAR